MHSCTHSGDAIPFNLASTSQPTPDLSPTHSRPYPCPVPITWPTPHVPPKCGHPYPIPYPKSTSHHSVGINSDATLPPSRPCGKTLFEPCRRGPRQVFLHEYFRKKIIQAIFSVCTMVVQKSCGFNCDDPWLCKGVVCFMCAWQLCK